MTKATGGGVPSPPPAVARAVPEQLAVEGVGRVDGGEGNTRGGDTDVVGTRRVQTDVVQCVVRQERHGDVFDHLEWSVVEVFDAVV